MNIFLVRPEQVAGLWAQVGPFIAAANDPPESRLYSEWDIKKSLIAGQWFLWIATEGEDIHAAVVARIADYPQARLYEVPYIGGRRMREWLRPMMEAIEGQARQLGARAMQGYSREGWCRVAGYREVGKVFAKDLEP